MLPESLPRKLELVLELPNDFQSSLVMLTLLV